LLVQGKTIALEVELFLQELAEIQGPGVIEAPPILASQKQ
jgi:hypothetical protein